MVETARRPRKSLVVLAGAAKADDHAAWRLTEALRHLGVEAVYLDLEESPASIAAIAAAGEADSIELCLGRCSGLQLVRTLLHELIELGRRDISIVLRRVN